ncbi:MAG TPA: DNA mismatch repair endonuclease MutL [Gemmatimonadaceae bacterium]|jgi:DNA mismatch repair protein MutL|nr:DNA mismatch repair endonuclease MutL [Gemmatimonadaceae bacterium]
MARIAVLPSAVADQIAAGEVVERPASAVKELVENALDAGATAVDIAVEEGGRLLIRVSDDGIGMERADAVLALERHATSKIRSASDLVGVTSFGFRGEALPAICSVSQLLIETAPADGAGTSVRAAGGVVLAVTDVARRRGTTITASQLFYNAPARQKFLRGPRSEWRGVMEAVATIALTRCDVRFTLSHDGKTALSLPAASSLRDRVAALWGSATADRMLDVEDVRGTVQVSGLAERPGDVGTASRRTFLTVNGRAIRDNGMLRAAEAAYRSTLSAGLRPSLLLALVVPSDSVDVNVHPAKAEVRFRDRWAVERCVEEAVRRALGTFDASAALGVRRWSAGGPMWSSTAPADVELLRPTAPAEEGLFANGSAPGVDVEDVTSDAPLDGARPPEPIFPPAPAPPRDARAEVVVPPLLQLRRTYMLFEHDDGVVLIDQHSAHERVLYEQFMGMLERGESPSQRLLFPLTLHLTPAEGDAFESNREMLARLGFEVEGFGGHTLLVSSVPMPHPRFDAERCLRETLATLAGDRESAAHARHERLAATVACKAAIKAGDELSAGEMRALFVALGDTRLPAHDVHGRSTIVQLSWPELERRFGRQ